MSLYKYIDLLSRVTVYAYIVGMYTVYIKISIPVCMRSIKLYTNWIISYLILILISVNLMDKKCEVLWNIIKSKWTFEVSEFYLNFAIDVKLSLIISWTAYYCSESSPLQCEWWLWGHIAWAGHRVRLMVMRAS